MPAFRLRGRVRALACVCMALTAGAALSACGDDEEDPATSAAAGGGAKTDDKAAVVAKAEKAIAPGFAGTDRELPTTGPKAVKGKDVWIIACTMEGEGCARPAQAAADAAKLLGWKATVADGKLDPNEQANQIRNAISAGADAIIPLSISCKSVPGAFQAAKEAGVKLYGLYARDCDKPLLDAKVEYGDFDEVDIDQATPAIANYVIAKSGGDGEIIQLDFDDGGGLRDIGDAFEKTVKANCPDCTIHNVPITGQDISQDKVQSLTDAALTKYPKADVVMSPVDGIILLGAGSAVGAAKAQGRDILLTGLEGLEPSLKMIASGGPQNVAAGSPGGWHGWAAIDGLNRLFAGEEQVDPGIGFQLIDKEHPPPSVPYDGNKKSLGYQDNYKRIWGIAG